MDDRAVARAEQRIPASCLVSFEHNGRKVIGQTQDISRHGLFLRTDALVPVGETVPMTMMLPEGPVQLSARVAHIIDRSAAHDSGRSCGLGCALAATGEPRKALDRFISEVADVRAPLAPIVPGTRVILAEPDARHLEQLSGLLRAAGFVVDESFDGSDAYTACLEQPPDLLVLAERMPGMDGWTLINKLAERPRTAGIAAVLLVDDGSEAVRLRAYRMGVYDCVVRPASDEEICLRVRRLAWLLRRGPA